jgi:hypothetical protein
MLQFGLSGAAPIGIKPQSTIPGLAEKNYKLHVNK